MACNCIKKIEDGVAVEEGAIRAFVNRVGWSEIQYKRTTKSGASFRRNSYTSIKWEFCPFCGEKL